jgi:hypothetical protein
MKDDQTSSLIWNELNPSHVAREVSHDLCDHQFRPLDSAQFLPIDADRNIAWSMTKARFEDVRYDDLETLDQGFTRRRLGRDPALCGGRDPHARIGVVEGVEG